MSKTLYFEGAGWSGADSSKATIGNCRIRTAFHLDPEKKHPRCSCGEPHDGAAAVYLEIICGTIGKENRKLGLEPTYYGWIDYLHYVTDDDRNDDCNRHILPFERRARIDYTLESILKFVNDLGASFDAVAVCPDFGGYRVFRDGYSPKGTERLNYGDEFQCDPDMTARREAVYRHVYELEKAEGSRLLPLGRPRRPRNASPPPAFLRHVQDGAQHALDNPNGHRQHRRGLDGNRHRDATRALWLLRALPQAQPNYTPERRETAWQQPQHPLPKVTSAMHVCRPDMRHETRRPSSSTTRPRP